jgi:glycosyltransferase involved in cell wall biosynthesis
MKISLVVPIRNETGTLAALVESIRGQTRQPDEVLLVDGGSTDDTVACARQLTAGDERLRVIEAGEATPGRGRNVGIAAARHEWIALTDAGIRLEPTWLERLARVVAEDPAVEVVYGNFEPLTTTRFERYAALSYPPAKQERPGGRMRGPFIASSLMRRAVWQAVGGFPDMRAAEDLFFMERVAQGRHRTGWAADATVWWQLQPTLGRTFRKFVLYSKHNVWAGRQWDWHYGIARQYLVQLAFVALALAHSFWWLSVPALITGARVAKGIWRQREGRGVLWALNPVQFLGVTIIRLTIDAATFVGWAQALRRRNAPQTMQPTASKS